MLRTLILIHLIFLIFSSNAQNIVCTGSFSGVSSVYSIGEIVVKPENHSHQTQSGFVSSVSSLLVSDLSQSINDGFIISVYPNPVSTTLIVNIESPSEEVFTAFIYNSSGVLNLKTMVSDFSELHISNLPAGIYLLIVRDNKNQVVLSSKIVKSL